MKNWMKYLSIFICYSLYTGVVSAIQGGQCYSRAQTSCQAQMTQLIVAQTERKSEEVCRHFGTVHTCIMKYMSICKYQKHEKDLYDKDIVQVYTRKPYNCALMGGNLQYRGEYVHSGTSSITAPILILLMPLVFILIQQ